MNTKRILLTSIATLLAVYGHAADGVFSNSGNLGTGNNDANVGLLGTKTYLNAVNLQGNALIINGVSFAASFNGNPTGTGFAVSGIPTIFGGGGTNPGGQLGALTNDFIYGGIPGTLALTGLTVGQTYSLAFYNRSWEAAGQRVQTFTATSGASTVFDQNAGATAQGDLSVLRYTFTASSTTETVTIAPQNTGNTFHFYGFSTEQVFNNAWTGGADWSTAAWAVGSPNARGANADFTAQAVPTTLNLDSARTVGHVRFAGANAWTVSGANTLTLQADVGGVSVLSATSGTHTISAGVDFQNNVLKTGAGKLSLSGPVADNGKEIVLGAGTLEIANSGPQSLSARMSGGGTFEKNGAGVLTVNGVGHTYTGDTVISNGTLKLAALSSGANIGTASYTNSSNAVFTPAANNLILGLAPSANVGGGAPEGTGNPLTMTDGTAGSGSVNAYTVKTNQVITYALPVSPLGFDLSAINFYTTWNDEGRDRIDISSVSYSTVQNPGIFVPIPNSAVSYDGTSINLLAALTATGGVLAANTHSIQINFATQENGHVGYRELEIVGVASNPGDGTGGINILPAASSVQIAAGALLDLNGNAQTVASLSGAGSIVNNSGATSTLTINKPSGTSTYGGAISDAGAGNQISLVKTGAGTQVLSGANTYTGPTTITGGRLDIAGSLTSTITVSGGAIGGEGVTTGALNFTGNSALNFAPATPGFLRAASVNATGATVTVVPSSVAPVTGVVALEALGGITGTVGSNFVFSGRGNMYLNGASGSATQLLVDFTPGALTWSGFDGTNPGVWDVATTNNWTIGNVTPTATVFYAGDSVTFNDSGNLNVTIQGTVAPNGVTFNISPFTFYALSGGSIAGSGGLAVNGGEVSLFSPHTYTGATTIGVGKLFLGDGTPGHDSSLATSGVVNQGVLTYNLAGNQTVTYPISGSGGVGKAGQGTLTINSANTYTGGTFISGGTLVAGNSQALGGFGGLIKVYSGGTLDLASAELSNYTKPIEIEGTGAAGSGGALVKSTADNGAGLQVRSLLLTGDATIGGVAFSRIDIGRVDWTSSVGNGVVHLDGGGFNLTIAPGMTVGIVGGATNVAGMVLNEGSVLLPYNDNSLASAVLTLNGGTLMPVGDHAFSNSITLTGTGGRVNFQGAAVALTGSISGTGPLVKQGAGTLTLAGVNSYTGVTVLEGGILNVANFSDYDTDGGLGNRSATGEGGQNVGILFRGGTLQYTGSTPQSTNRAVRISTIGGGTIDASGSTPAATLTFSRTTASPDNWENGGNRTFTLTGSNAGDNTFATPINDLAGQTVINLTKTGAGKWVLPAASSYKGITTLEGGILNVGILSDYGFNGSLGNRTVTDDVGGNVGILFRGGTLQYTGSTAQSTNRAIRISTAGGTIDASGANPSATLNFTATGSPDFFENPGDRTLVFTGSNAGTNTFAGAIGQAGGVTSVVKNGVGQWVLTNASGYTGATTINAGLLTVNGDISGSATTVNLGGTLGGIGSVGAVTVLGGTVAPGAGVGTLTTGAFSITEGSFLAFELSTPDIQGSGINDFIAVSGSLALDGTLQITELSPLVSGEYPLFSYTTGLVDGGLALEAAFLSAHPGSYIDTSTEFEVSLVVVPEPSTAVLLLGGLGVLTRRRRRS